MSPSARGTEVPVESLRTCATTVDQVRRASRHLEALLRGQIILDGPGELYYLLGVWRQVATALEASLGHVGSWLDEHDIHGRLAVSQGPFGNDPTAAVATATLALTDARHTVSQLDDALLRAQLTASHLVEARSARRRSRPAEPGTP